MDNEAAVTKNPTGRRFMVRALQNFLATGVRLQNDLPERIRTVAGVDVSYQKHGDRFFDSLSARG